MSSFGFLNVSGIDGVGSGSGGGGSLPGGIDKSVQFNDGGLAFGGVSSFLFDKVTNVLTVPKVKPAQIVDGSNSVGTAGQVLSSTGTALQYVTPSVTVPGAPSTSVQFNQGGVFTGDFSFIFDNTIGVKRLTLSQVKPTFIVDGSNSIGTAGQVLSSTGTGLSFVNPTASVPAGSNEAVQFNNSGAFGGTANFTFTSATSHLKTQGKLSVGTLFTTIPRLFAQSGNANASIPVWDENWLVVGGGSGASNSTGVGIGYNNATNTGLIACIQPTVAFRDLVFEGSNYSFRNGGTDLLKINNTGNLKFARLLDDLNSVGTAGQVLTSTGTGLRFITRDSANMGAQGPFGTVPPTAASPILFSFTPLRSSVYTLDCSCTAFNFNGAVGTILLYMKFASQITWTGIVSTSYGLAGSNIRGLFPTMNTNITVQAGNAVQFFIQTVASSSNIGDFLTATAREFN